MTNTTPEKLTQGTDGTGLYKAFEKADTKNGKNYLGRVAVFNIG